MDFITTPLVLLIIFGTFYKVVRLYATRRERILYLEKMMQTLPPTMIDGESQVNPLPPYSFMSEGRKVGRFTALRWGMLSLGVGMGIFVAVLILAWLNEKMFVESPWMLTGQYGVFIGGSMLLFGGLGLVIAYVIESRHRGEE